jgi:beta-glucosidase
MQGRTYRFFTGKPLYPFGFGLSYSIFEYSQLKLQKTPSGELSVSVRVRNTSPVAGDEVAQLYIGPAGTVPWLKGFQRVHFAPNQSAELHWTIPPSDIHGNIVTVGGVQGIVPAH